jgi:2-polyprenyl-6-methoxyphenol hydroxylase-like FAD-dependent oxidoreductase
MRPHYDVVVVGGGPVGVGLALDLGLRGISCVVLERRTELSRIPKGQGLSQRTMEHMRRWGVAEQLRAARTMPPGHAIGQVTVYESLLGEFWHAPPGRELVQPFYAEANERLPQYRTEEVLRRRLGGLPDGDLELGTTATAVEQDADGVRVNFERDGRPQVVTGSHVVGCDGGHSLVRQQADIPRAGTDFGELVALVVFRSRKLHEALERLPDRSTYRVMHPDLQGYWMFFGRVDVGEEFFFHAPVPRGADADSVDVGGLLHARRASPSSARWSTSVSGTFGCRSPRATAPAGRSWPATPPTPTRLTAASA